MNREKYSLRTEKISSVVFRLACLAMLATSPLALRGQQEPLKITDLRLSNHLGTACVLSWRTNYPTTVNEVRYSKDPTNLSLKANDTYQKETMIHYVQLQWLDINATYYYRVRSDGLEYSISLAGVDSVVTFPQKLASKYLLMYGNVVNQDNAPFERVLVRSFIKDPVYVDSSMWFADLTNSTGAFDFDLINFRSYSGSVFNYRQNKQWLHLEILGPTQGVERDSVLLTASAGLGNNQNVGIYKLIDERKKATHGRVRASGPVLADGFSASVVWITVMDLQDKPVSNVEIMIQVSGQGNTIEQPLVPTDGSGRTYALLRSLVAETKIITAFNISADTAQIDSTGRVDFVVPPGDIAQDTVPPFIVYTTEYPNTTDNVGPYTITSRIVDNFSFSAKLVFTTGGNIYTDTLLMTAPLGSSDYAGNIPGKPWGSVVKYFVVARDSAGLRTSDPPNIITNPFILPFRFEVLFKDQPTVARMGITNTTDALSLSSPNYSVHIDTWVTTSVGIRASVIKWRNINRSSIFFDIPLLRYGAHMWGEIPPMPLDSHIEYFIQVVDSLGRVERDGRRAPVTDLFDYYVRVFGARSFADTTSYLATTDVHRSMGAAVGDLNGDGYPDVVVANYGEPNSVYFYNPNTGKLDDYSAQALGVQRSEKSTHVVLANLDNDDDLDLVVANEGEQSRLYLNNGLGSFDDVTSVVFGSTGKTRMPAELWGSVCVLAEDFDGNGTIDLFFANSSLNGAQNTLLLNDSTAVFRDVTQSFLMNPPIDRSEWAIAGDVNGDGAPDIVVINRAQDPVIFYNKGHGIFQWRILTHDSYPQAKGGDLGDVDGDGDLDLVIAQSDIQQNELFINDGSGNFENQTSGRLPLVSDNTHRAKFFDADGDGDLDLYFINYGEYNRLLLNNGVGFFTDAPSTMIPVWQSYSKNAAVTDFNKDGQPDLYISEEDRRNTLLLSRASALDLGNLPSSFDLVSPANRDTVSSVSVRFVWRASIAADSLDTLSYRLVLSADSTFSQSGLIADRSGLSDTILTLSGLSNSTRYWWKVEVRGQSGYPVQCRQVFNFLVLDTKGPEFLVLLNRNPVFPGFMNIYLIASETLSSAPTLTVNLKQVQLTQVAGSDIWSGHFNTRSGFILYARGVDMMGQVGEYTKNYSAVLAASGGQSVIPSADGKAWLTLGTGSSDGGLLVLVQHHEPVRNEKIKTKTLALDGSQADLAAVLEGNCFSFVPLEGTLRGRAWISIKGENSSARERLAVCIFENGTWNELPGGYDSRSQAWTAATDRLGTFALRPAESANTATLPRTYTLAQNSPNPFNPSTRIAFTVPLEVQAARVSICVYNLRGQLVSTLVDDRYGPGQYSVEWDGKDLQGRGLASGVYLYRLRTEAVSITRKMVLIR